MPTPGRRRARSLRQAEPPNTQFQRPGGGPAATRPRPRICDHRCREPEAPSDEPALPAKASALPIADPAARTFSRFIFAGAFEVDLDRQGRMVIPSSLRSWAALNGEAVVVGSRDHAEIWAPARWDDYRKAMESPDE